MLLSVPISMNNDLLEAARNAQLEEPIVQEAPKLDLRIELEALRSEHQTLTNYVRCMEDEMEKLRETIHSLTVELAHSYQLRSLSQQSLKITNYTPFIDGKWRWENDRLVVIPD